MTLATAFASLATRVSAATGSGPFYAAKLILAPATPGGLNDDGVFVPGSPPVLADCLCQIDAVNEAWRAQAGFTDRDYRFLLLDGDFRDAIDTDASIQVTDAAAPADFRVTWAVSSLARDPAGVGLEREGAEVVMPIKVTDHHAARLLRLSPTRIMPAMGEELQSGAQAIEDTMRRNMNDGAISGSGHIPGPPGGYASTDAHKMEESIKAVELIETPTEIKTSVSAGDSEAPYSIYVEMGTSKAAPHPGLQLATEEHRSDITEALGGRFIREVNE